MCISASVCLTNSPGLTILFTCWGWPHCVSMSSLSGAFCDGRRQLRTVDAKAMGFCSFGEKGSYIQLMTIVLPHYLCLSRVGRVGLIATLKPAAN
jgi:hypothetical protein